MIGQDELKKQQEYQELDLLKKFYDFACQCKSKENKGDKHEVEFDCGSSGKLKFNYDLNCGNLIPTDNINDIDLTKKTIFCCIGGFFVMFSQGKNGKTNVYALNNTLINKIDNNFDIKPYVFKIKNVPIENAKKFLSSFDDVLLSPFDDNQERSNANNFAKQVKNELDFKYVFSEIVNNNENNIDEIVSENHKQLDVIKNIRDGYNEIHGNIGNRISFKGFDNEDVQLNYDVKTDSVSNDNQTSTLEQNAQTSTLEQNAYYFGKYGLLMAITKSNDGKVNVFATNANMQYNNPYGGNDKYAGLFAVYDASKEDAERFIQKLNSCNMAPVNYKIIDSQEKFEQFFQDHCKNNEIKIEDKEVDDGCCLFNLCGCGKQQNVVN